MISDPSVPDTARRKRRDRDDPKGAVADQAVTIGKPRDEVYARFRNFADLPRFMRNLERVDDLGDGRTHWVVKAPAGRTVEWDAITTEDEPGRLNRLGERAGRGHRQPRLGRVRRCAGRARHRGARPHRLRAAGR